MRDAGHNPSEQPRQRQSAPRGRESEYAMGKYLLNQETQKIELHFDKSEYLALSEAQKSEIKRFFLWSRYAGAWVSRGTRDHYFAKKTAESLGLEWAGKEGERLSFAEEMERKAEKAEARADRFETYAENAKKRAERLTAPINSMHGDIAFFTQPNINSSAGRAFKNRRERMFQQFENGMQEYRKSAYYEGRAATARATADQTQLKSPRYLNNRIEEANAQIRAIERRIVEAEEKENAEWLERLLDSMEREMDKLAYYQNALEELGTIQKIYTRDDLKIGYLVQVRHGSWATVKSLGPKKFDADYLDSHLRGCFCNYPYAEIKDVKIPEGWTEPKKEEHPYKAGAIFAKYGCGGAGAPYKAWECISTSALTITIRPIKIENGTPIPGAYIGKATRKTPKRSRFDNSWCVYDDDWQIYVYNAKQTATA